MIRSAHAIAPEIYGSITDPERVELDGLLYIFQRLPKGIEVPLHPAHFREGFEHSAFEPSFLPSAAAAVAASTRNRCSLK